MMELAYSRSPVRVHSKETYGDHLFNFWRVFGVPVAKGPFNVSRASIDQTLQPAGRMVHQARCEALDLTHATVDGRCAASIIS